MAAVRLGIESIRDYPKAWPIHRRHFRRYLLGKFPYALVYVEHRDLIEIVAVAQLDRKPGYWRDRI